MLEALRNFRYGLIDRQVQDQFQRFWFAVEVIAEGLKETEKTTIPCPKCQNALYCSTCKELPQRRPMARQAIFGLIQKIVGQEGEKVYRKLVRVRDGLMHGRSQSSIEAEAAQDFASLVDEMATLAWHAIMAAMPERLGSTPLRFMHRDGRFAARELRVGPVGSFDCDEALDYPPEDKIPDIKISMDTTFRLTPAG